MDAQIYSLDKKRAYDHKDYVDGKLKMCAEYKEGFNEGFTECYALFNTLFNLALQQNNGIMDANVLIYVFSSVNNQMKLRNINQHTGGDDGGNLG